MQIEFFKMLYLRFCNFYGEKFTRMHTPESMEIWYQDWADGLAGIEINAIKEAIDYCKLNLCWAPSLAEFIGICDKLSGMPNALECMIMAVNGDFSNSIVRNLYDRIGSWNIRNNSEYELLRKFESNYPDEIAKFRSKRQRDAILIDHKITPIDHHPSPESSL